MMPALPHRAPTQMGEELKVGDKLKDFLLKDEKTPSMIFDHP